MLFLIILISSVGWLYITCRLLNRLAALSDRLISLTFFGGIFLLLTPVLFAYWYFNFNQFVTGLFSFDIFAAANQNFWQLLLILIGFLAFFSEIIRRKIRHKKIKSSINIFCRLQSTKNVDCPLISSKKSFWNIVYKVFSAIPGNKINKFKILNYKIDLQEKINLKIAHLTDIHFVNRVSKKYYEKIVSVVNEQKPDVVLFTGDFLQSADSLENFKSVFSKLKAKKGIYFICGNHDIWHDEKPTVKMLEQLGFIHIAGEIKELNNNLFLAGTEQPWKKDDIEKKISNLPDGARVVLLSHSPDNARKLYSQKIKLILSGHTHGGQNALPLLGPLILPSKYGTLYEAGFTRYGNVIIFVSRGLAVHHPLRFNCFLEIVFMVLD